MNFSIENFKVKKATEDIECTMFVRLIDDKLYTIQLDMLLEPNKTYGDNNMKLNIGFIEYVPNKFKCVTDSLFISNRNDTDGFYFHFDVPYEKLVLTSCFIPKGTYYLENEFEYLSAKIKIGTEIIK